VEADVSNQSVILSRGGYGDYHADAGRFVVRRIGQFKRGDNWHVTDSKTGQHRFVYSLDRVREEIALWRKATA
jgi:hypothetical protein